MRPDEKKNLFYSPLAVRPIADYPGAKHEDVRYAHYQVFNKYSGAYLPENVELPEKVDTDASVRVLAKDIPRSFTWGEVPTLSKKGFDACRRKLLDNSPIDNPQSEKPAIALLKTLFPLNSAIVGKSIESAFRFYEQNLIAPPYSPTAKGSFSARYEAGLINPLHAAHFRQAEGKLVLDLYQTGWAFKNTAEACKETIENPRSADLSDDSSNPSAQKIASLHLNTTYGWHLAPASALTLPLPIADWTTRREIFPGPATLFSALKAFSDTTPSSPRPLAAYSNTHLASPLALLRLTSNAFPDPKNDKIKLLISRIVEYRNQFTESPRVWDFRQRAKKLREIQLLLKTVRNLMNANLAKSMTDPKEFAPNDSKLISWVERHQNFINDLTTNGFEDDKTAAKDAIQLLKLVKPYVTHQTPLFKNLHSLVHFFMLTDSLSKEMMAVLPEKYREIKLYGNEASISDKFPATQTTPHNDISYDTLKISVTGKNESAVLTELAWVQESLADQAAQTFPDRDREFRQILSDCLRAHREFYRNEHDTQHLLLTINKFRKVYEAKRYTRFGAWLRRGLRHIIVRRRVGWLKNNACDIVLKPLADSLRNARVKSTSEASALFRKKLHLIGRTHKLRGERKLQPGIYDYSSALNSEVSPEVLDTQIQNEIQKQVSYLSPDAAKSVVTEFKARLSADIENSIAEQSVTTSLFTEIKTPTTKIVISDQANIDDARIELNTFIKFLMTDRSRVVIRAVNSLKEKTQDLEFFYKLMQEQYETKKAELAKELKVNLEVISSTLDPEFLGNEAAGSIETGFLEVCEKVLTTYLEEEKDHGKRCDELPSFERAIKQNFLKSEDSYEKRIAQPIKIVTQIETALAELHQGFLNPVQEPTEEKTQEEAICQHLLERLAHKNTWWKLGVATSNSDEADALYSGMFFPETLETHDGNQFIHNWRYQHFNDVHKAFYQLTAAIEASWDQEILLPTQGDTVPIKLSALIGADTFPRAIENAIRLILEWNTAYQYFLREADADKKETHIDTLKTLLKTAPPSIHPILMSIIKENLALQEYTKSHKLWLQFQVQLDQLEGSNTDITDQIKRPLEKTIAQIGDEEFKRDAIQRYDAFLAKRDFQKLKPALFQAEERVAQKSALDFAWLKEFYKAINAYTGRANLPEEAHKKIDITKKKVQAQVRELMRQNGKTYQFENINCPVVPDQQTATELARQTYSLIGFTHDISDDAPHHCWYKGLQHDVMRSLLNIKGAQGRSLLNKKDRREQTQADTLQANFKKQLKLAGCENVDDLSRFASEITMLINATCPQKSPGCPMFQIPFYIATLYSALNPTHMGLEHRIETGDNPHNPEIEISYDPHTDRLENVTLKYQAFLGINSAHVEDTIAAESNWEIHLDFTKSPYDIAIQNVSLTTSKDLTDQIHQLTTRDANDEKATEKLREAEKKFDYRGEDSSLGITESERRLSKPFFDAVPKPEEVARSETSSVISEASSLESLAPSPVTPDGSSGDEADQEIIKAKRILEKNIDQVLQKPNSPEPPQTNKAGLFKPKPKSTDREGTELNEEPESTGSLSGSKK